MDFYIVRHGPAEERGEAWPDDRKRPLTSDGKDKTSEAARGLRALGVSPDMIFTSPLVRARQTAEIVAKELDLASRVRETDHLEPGALAYPLLVEMAEAAPLAGAVMVVGHEPDLGYLVSRLLTGDGNAVQAPLKKAGVVKIELDALPPRGRGVLAWMLAPGQLRRLARGK